MVGIWIIVSILLIVILYMFSVENHILYCYVYQTKDVWLYFKFRTIDLSHYHYNKTVSWYHYIDCDIFPDYDFIVDTKDKIVFVSHKNTQDCIVSTFYDRGAKKLFKKLNVLVENQKI